MSLQSNVTSNTGWHSAAHASAIIGLPEAVGILPLQIRQVPDAPAPRLPVIAPASDHAARQEVPINELSFRALETPGDIAAIHYLRDELSLPGSVLADPEFQILEKKETSGAWWALSA